MQLLLRFWPCPHFTLLSTGRQDLFSIVSPELLGVGVSITVLYFPLTYIISDIVTEVYGYAVARMILWYTLLASVLAGLMYQLAVYVPAAPSFAGGDAYKTVFGIV
ncbi:MAG: VUT family protein, partial [Acidobacteria bacterium]|nr:VUT family protein [Acidobacteriota bacterium]